MVALLYPLEELAEVSHSLLHTAVGMSKHSRCLLLYVNAQVFVSMYTGCYTIVAKVLFQRAKAKITNAMNKTKCSIVQYYCSSCVNYCGYYIMLLLNQRLG